MSRPSDQDVDVSVALALRVGITLSAAVVVLGGVLMGNHFFSMIPNYQHFQPGDPGLQSFAGILQGAVNFTPMSVIQLGLLLLIATPIARVVLCLVGFARQHNALYVVISTLVLAVLLLSFFRGGR